MKIADLECRLYNYWRHSLTRDEAHKARMQPSTRVYLPLLRTALDHSEKDKTDQMLEVLKPDSEEYCGSRRGRDNQAMPPEMMRST